MPLGININPSIQSTLLHIAVCALLSLLWLFPSASSAQLGGINIESAKIIDSSPESITVEVTASNNGKLDGVYMGVTTESPQSYHPIVLPVGEKNQIRVIVSRPTPHKGLQTHFLNVFAYRGGESIFLKRQFKQKHSWSDLSDSTVSRTVVPTRRETEDPYFEISEAMRYRDFITVDALATEWSTNQERDPNGTLKLGAITAYFSNPGCLAEFAITSDWQKQDPHSILPSIIEARCRSDHYCIRDGMDPLSIELAQKEFSLAKEALLRTKANAADSPLWYEAYLNVVIASKEDEKTINIIFEEATKKFPQYDPLYLTMASRLFIDQRYIKEIKKLNQLADRFVKATAIKEGNAGYVHMYSYINQRLWEVNVFRDEVFSWEKIKGGFDDLISRYPSTINLHRYALASCQANDKETYLSLKKRIGDQIIADFRVQNYTVDICDRRFSENTELKI